jgi:hypothetical protein
MGILSYVQSIYTLDTIDTRFTNSSSTPYRVDPTAAASKRDDSKPGAEVRLDSNGRPRAQPSRWNTPEFYFYYFVFLTVVPYMFWIGYDVSRRQYTEHLLLVIFLTAIQLLTLIIINSSLTYPMVGSPDARLYVMFQEISPSCADTV